MKEQIIILYKDYLKKANKIIYRVGNVFCSKHIYYIKYDNIKNVWTGYEFREFGTMVNVDNKKHLIINYHIKFHTKIHNNTFWLTDERISEIKNNLSNYHCSKIEVIKYNY